MGAALSSERDRGGEDVEPERCLTCETFACSGGPSKKGNQDRTRGAANSRSEATAEELINTFGSPVHAAAVPSQMPNCLPSKFILGYSSAPRNGKSSASSFLPWIKKNHLGNSPHPPNPHPDPHDAPLHLPIPRTNPPKTPDNPPPAHHSQPPNPPHSQMHISAFIPPRTGICVVYNAEAVGAPREIGF